MSPEGKKALSWSWGLGDILASSYHTVAILAMIIGLVVWSVRQEGRIHELESIVTSLAQRINDVDIHGTRALSARVDVLATQLPIMDQHIIALNKDLSERMTQGDATINDRISQLTTRFTNWEQTWRKIDVMEARQADVLRRLEKIESSRTR